MLFPSPGDLPDPGIEPWSPTLQADSSPSEPPRKPFQYMESIFYLFICGEKREFLYLIFLNLFLPGLGLHSAQGLSLVAVRTITIEERGILIVAASLIAGQEL